MFRTSNNRGNHRFQELVETKFNRRGIISLNKKQLQLIEESDIFTLSEKIELLLISLGNKLTTEIYLKINYVPDDLSKLYLPDKKDLATIEMILNQLPFQWYQDSLLKKNQIIHHQEMFTWYQVSVNEAVAHFMKAYPNDLTEFEEGVLYGFPLTAIRAFSGLIEPSHKKTSVASHYLAGVCSQDFRQDEEEYYQLWWNRLKTLSPALIAKVENEFRNS